MGRLGKIALVWIAPLALAACASSASGPENYRPRFSGGDDDEIARLLESQGEDDAPRIVQMNPPLSCTPYARERSGIDIHGDAYEWWDLAKGHYASEYAPT